MKKLLILGAGAGRDHDGHEDEKAPEPTGVGDNSH